MAHSASFRRVLVSPRGSLLLGIGVLSALPLLGCDSPVSQADKTVSDQLDDAAMKIAAPDNSQMAAAHQELDTAARETADSPAVQLRAKAMLADSELRLAQALAAKVQHNDVLIDRLAREIGLLGDEIQTNNLQVAALAKEEPTAAQAAVEKNSADLKGSDEKPDWYKTPDTSLPSLSANDKQMADLQTQVSLLQDSIKTETDQRNQLLEQADKLTEQSEHGDPVKAEDLYVQGSNSRKQAAELSIKLDGDNAALKRAQDDMKVKQGQHDSLTASLTSFQEKSSTFGSGWSDVQKKIEAINANSKALIGDDPVTAPTPDPKTGDLKTEMTIGSKAAALAALAKANHQLRVDAETHFNSAIGFYKDAFDRATQVQQSLGAQLAKRPEEKNPDAQAIAELKYALEPGNFRFLQADAELQKAEFFARSAAEEKARIDLDNRLKPELAGAQMTSFPSLDDTDQSLDAQMKKDQTSARDAFKDSTDLLEKIYEGSGLVADTKNQAQVAQIFAQYAWSSLEAAAGDAQAAALHLESARTAVSQASSSNVAMPPLPAELVPTAAAQPK